MSTPNRVPSPPQRPTPLPNPVHVDDPWLTLRPVNKPARQALAMGAVLVIAFATALVLITLHGQGPPG